MPPRKPAKGRTRLPFVLFKELFTNRCFVDEEILNEHEAGVLRGSFENESQEEVVVHVPTAEFYELHRRSEDNLEL